MYMDVRDVACMKLGDGLFFIRIAGQPHMANPYLASKRRAELWFGGEDGNQMVSVVTYTDPKCVTAVDVHDIYFIPETADEQDLVFAKISEKNAWYEGFLVDRNKINLEPAEYVKTTIKREPYKRLRTVKN
jgi:hypothetical protein